MKSYFDRQVSTLYDKANGIIGFVAMLKANRRDEKIELDIPAEFTREFFSLVDRVSLNLMEERDNFYGYFLFQMSREIRFDISSPTAVNFKGAKYVIYFNPLLFLMLDIKQMESAIKHEILHIVSRHLIRAKELRGRYSKLAVNMAMDIVVNKYLDYLPSYATTLESVNSHYNLELESYKTFEYYVEKLQLELDLHEENKDGEEHDTNTSEEVQMAYSPEKTHDIWEDSGELDEKTMGEFTNKFIEQAQKGSIPTYLEDLIASLRGSKEELPWNLYLRRLMGTVESNKKKTISRRSRRQPERLDLRGTLRNHKAQVAVALDTSGSISEEEFKQAIKEVLHIVKNYNHEITLIECDQQIRRTYKVNSVKDVKDRMNRRGGTQFSPVFEYANQQKINLLVYFTDGKGEDTLRTIPRGYHILWVISGKGDKLSLKEPYGMVKKLKKITLKETHLDMSDVRSDGYSMNNQEASLI